MNQRFNPMDPRIRFINLWKRTMDPRVHESTDLWSWVNTFGPGPRFIVNPSCIGGHLYVPQIVHGATLKMSTSLKMITLNNKVRKA